MTRLKLYSLILLILPVVYIYSQDTIFLDKKINYYSTKGDSIRFNKSKRYKAYPKVDYAREIIKLGNDTFKIENCYYYDGVRYTKQQSSHYKIIDDSVLVIDNQTWIFKRVDDSLLYITNNDGDYKEKGTVLSLVPLIKHGDFLTYNPNNELLLIEHYRNGKCIEFKSPEVPINDSVYLEPDTGPVFPDKYGALEQYISQRYNYPELAIESSIQGRVFIRFVITSEGKVINPKVIRGVDPAIDKEALKVVANLPDFEPARLNGINVNAYYILPVDYMIK